jgi:hypothetical protein
MDVPDNMAAVIPTILLLFSASLTRVSPKTSCHRGVEEEVDLIFSPVSGSKLPGACHA